MFPILMKKLIYFLLLCYLSTPPFQKETLAQIQIIVSRKRNCFVVAAGAGAGAVVGGAGAVVARKLTKYLLQCCATMYQHLFLNIRTMMSREYNSDSLEPGIQNEHVQHFMQELVAAEEHHFPHIIDFGLFRNSPPISRGVIMLYYKGAFRSKSVFTKSNIVLALLQCTYNINSLKHCRDIFKKADTICRFTIC